MDVQVRLDPDGQAVLIGTPPAGPAGLGVVAVAGAEIYLDPTTPDDLPYAVVQEVEEAEYAFEGVYGQGVAEAVARIAASEVGDELVLAEPGPMWAAVRTIGLVRWLEDSSPDLLSTGLLDIELGSAAADLGDALAEHLQADGEQRLVRSADLVVELSRRLREPGTPAPPAGLAELVAAAVPQLGAVLPVDSPYYDDLEHEDELARALRALGSTGTMLDWAELAAQPGVGRRELLGATRAGPAVTPVAGADQLASVDWHQVPRGLLDTAEDTVRWSVSGNPDEPTVRVAVRAATGAPDSGRLAFRVYTSGFPLPLAFGGLHRSADRTEFVGSAALLAPAQGPLTVDIHDTRDTRPPRSGADAVLARATRWAARGVTALRLGGHSTAGLGTARGALEEAGELFAEAAETPLRPGAQALARRREARCDALVRAVLLRGGHQRMAAQMGGPWSPPPEPVTEADVRPPDLALPGWSPLVAERALGTDPSWGAR